MWVNTLTRERKYFFDAENLRDETNGDFAFTMARDVPEHEWEKLIERFRTFTNRHTFVYVGGNVEHVDFPFTELVISPRVQRIVGMTPRTFDRLRSLVNLSTDMDVSEDVFHRSQYDEFSSVTCSWRLLKQLANQRNLRTLRLTLPDTLRGLGRNDEMVVAGNVKTIVLEVGVGHECVKPVLDIFAASLRDITINYKGRISPESYAQVNDYPNFERLTLNKL